MVNFEDVDFNYINAEFIMTNACNLQCDYCFERKNMTNNQQFFYLSFENMCGYMDLIIENRKKRKISQDYPSQINFFGGEPLLEWEKIYNLMEKYKNYSFFKYSIITNGTLLNEEKLQKFKNFPILWQISLDSIKPEGNYPRFKEKSQEFTEHIIKIIKKINDYGFETPIISSVISSYSVSSMFETYSYFADNKIPIKWQVFFERLENQNKIIPEYENQNKLILNKLIKTPYNIPILWENVINYIRNNQLGKKTYIPISLSEAPSPNNLYIVSPNGKLYMSTNEVNIHDSAPIFSSIGELPKGINIDKLKNHPLIKNLKKEIQPECFECPSFAVNPCCFEQLYYVYPRQFQGNCYTFLSATNYALKFLQQRGEI